MKVQGSAFYFGDEVDAANAKFPAYFAILAALAAPNQWPIHRPFTTADTHRRRLYVNDLTDAWCGVVLSGRTTDFHHYIQQTGNTIRVIAQRTGQNPPVDVNFFSIRKDSHKGIYSSYYGSYAFGTFIRDLWQGYLFGVTTIKNVAVSQLGTSVTSRELEAANEAYSVRGKGQYGPLVNPGTFETLIQQLESISEVNVTTYAVDSPADRPVSDRIRNVHKTFRLEEGHRRVDKVALAWLRSVKHRASRTLKSGKRSFSGSVVGETADGKELTIPFGSFMDDYLDFDYDAIGTFDVTALANNACLAQMLTALRARALFRPSS